MATRETLYLKLERNVETQKKEIHLSDLGKLVCADKEILARAKALKVCSFRDETKKRCVVSVMKILEELQKIDPSLEVQNIGEAEVIVERVKAEQKKRAVALAENRLCLPHLFFRSGLYDYGLSQ